MSGSDSTRMTVLDGGRGILVGEGKERGRESAVGCKGSVARQVGTKRRGCLARHGCLRDAEVEFPSGQRWAQGVTNESVLAKWDPAGDVGLLRARRRGIRQAVSATGGVDWLLAR